MPGTSEGEARVWRDRSCGGCRCAFKSFCIVDDALLVQQSVLEGLPRVHEAGRDASQGRWSMKKEEKSNFARSVPISIRQALSCKAPRRLLRVHHVQSTAN